MTGEQQFCTFIVGDMLLGVQVTRVQEVIRFQHMTRVPLADEVVEGLINLRGQIVTAIDLRRRMGLPERPEGTQPMNVVLTSRHGAVSLLVDAIGDVVEVTPDSFEDVPDTVDGVARDLVTGTYKLAGQLLLALDPDRAVQITADARA